MSAKDGPPAGAVLDGCLGCGVAACILLAVLVLGLFAGPPH